MSVVNGTILPYKLGASQNCRILHADALAILFSALVAYVAGPSLPTCCLTSTNVLAYRRLTSLSNGCGNVTLRRING
eukprot:scaffold16113_cov50-Attheya_sp.AAC.3